MADNGQQQLPALPAETTFFGMIVGTPTAPCFDITVRHETPPRDEAPMWMDISYPDPSLGMIAGPMVEQAHALVNSALAFGGEFDPFAEMCSHDYADPLYGTRWRVGPLPTKGKIGDAFAKIVDSSACELADCSQRNQITTLAYKPIEGVKVIEQVKKNSPPPRTLRASKRDVVEIRHDVLKRHNKQSFKMSTPGMNVEYPVCYRTCKFWRYISKCNWMSIADKFTYRWIFFEMARTRIQFGTVIYLPPGCGKSTFTHAMRSIGVKILDSTDVHQWELPEHNGKFDASGYIVVTNYEKWLTVARQPIAIMPTRDEYIRRTSSKGISDIYSNLYNFFNQNREVVVLETDHYITHFNMVMRHVITKPATVDVVTLGQDALIASRYWYRLPTDTKDTAVHLP